MQMINVSSSNIKSVGYENNTLYVCFHSGYSLYAYSNVPRHLFEQLLSASSKGSFFATYIKNSYPYKRIG